MNRLVLIGNGYDLAAGLKTSYEDFIVDYFKQAYYSVQGKDQKYDDNIIEVVRINPKFNNENFNAKIDSIVTIDNLLKNKIAVIDNPKSEHVTSMETTFEVKIKSRFLSQLLTKSSSIEYWREIESYYFEKLLDIFNKIVNINTNPIRLQGEDTLNRYNQGLSRLNDEFEQIKIKLAEYLKRISDELDSKQSDYPASIIGNINNSMSEKDFKHFFNKSADDETENAVEKCMIINFNYTNLLNKHLRWNTNERKDVSTLHIHGSTFRPKEIIFGYGDDTHPMYSKLELTGNDEYLKHLKSFYYPLSENYLNLMNFIDLDQFEVQIIGHSLGLSDRVLLKSIFENSNCKCITLKHRGRTNEKELMNSKYMALSRHFDDKVAMRKKIKPFDVGDCLR